MELSKDVNKAFLLLKEELRGDIGRELYSCRVNLWLQTLISVIHLSLFPALNYTQDSLCVFTDYVGAQGESGSEEMVCLLLIES